MSKQQSLKLLRCTSFLMKIDPDMTLTRLNIFLRVGRGRNVLVRDLKKETGLSQPAIARTLAFLSDKPARGSKEGLDWVVATPDPDDPRRYFYNLTPKGQAVLSDLEDLI